MQDVDRFVETRPRWPLGPRDDHIECAQQKGKQPSQKRKQEELERKRAAKAAKYGSETEVLEGHGGKLADK